MQFLGELRVKAQVKNLRLVLYFVNNVGQQIHLKEKTLFDVELALEEALVNIVNHAYPATDEGDMVIKLETANDTFYLTLIDWGVPFDEAKVKSFDKFAPIEQRIQGGMGLHFIQTLMDGIHRRVATEPGQPNELTLVKRFERLQDTSQASRSTRELNAMLNVSKIISSAIDLGNLLEEIVNQLVEAVSAERGTLYLIDEETGELFSRILMEDAERLEEIRMTVGEGIAGKVAETGQLLNVTDAYKHPDFTAEFDTLAGFRTHDILAVPMRNRHQDIIGVVQLLNKHGGEFNSRDERLLTAMASQAAISIENARLYEQEMHQQLINQDLEMAHRIQESFLPDTEPRYQGWELAAFWQPMREVGGDFYDFYRLADGRMAVLIADVSGKGVPAAMFMALSVTVLRFAMALKFAPYELLNHANQLLIADQKSKMFATVFVAYIDFETGEGQCASAGHNPPLLYHAETGQFEYLEVSGVAMGLFTAAEFEDSRFTIQSGDVLVMYTDGITEVLDDDEEEFGEDRLESLIRENVDKSAQELSDLIIETVKEFSSGVVLDDETLIVIKRD